ncbi:MAG: type II toxin-antitoxin system RelE/ParE family toxin [Rhodospirillaceae bacterium]|nr:type II toxin-antitoxin system RelE/ParE family toxin [Rhodospirillaceae bacterium]
MSRPDTIKSLRWMGDSRENLRCFPKSVRRRIGFAIYAAQEGGKLSFVKPMRGFGGAGVLEIVVESHGNAYRGVYAVKFASAVYVLHVFQKKSKRGIATPKAELDLIRARLAHAEQEHRAWLEKNRTPSK